MTPETKTRLRWELSFEQDRAARMSPEVCTQALWAAVPVAEAVGLEYLEIDEGSARACLPLRSMAGNQHGTHQALIVALAGDYTGGVAVASLLRGVPILGVHPNETGEAISLWLAGTEITYLRPSTEELHVSAQVPADAVDGLRADYEAGRSALVPVPVFFRDPHGELIAEGKFTYFVRSSTALAPGRGKAAHIMHLHRTKSSARLIAAVRALEAAHPEPLFDDPFAARVAGAQGRIMAERFTILLPQLPEMVANRTRSADEALRSALAEGVDQIVILAVGLDFRALRFPEAGAEVRYFEADLPEMLAFRARASAALGAARGHRVPVPLDLLHDDPAARLAAAGLDLGRPVLVLYEGVSMYFAPVEAMRVLRRLAALVRRHPASRLWLDMVSEQAVGRRLDDARARAFLDGMARLGEPFRFGHDAPGELLGGLGLEVLHDHRADRFRPREGDVLFEHYRLISARPRAR